MHKGVERYIILAADGAVLRSYPQVSPTCFLCCLPISQPDIDRSPSRRASFILHPSSHTQHPFLHTTTFIVVCHLFLIFFIPGSRGCWRDGCDVQVGCKKSCARRSWFRSIWFTKFCATSNSQQRVDDWCWQRVYRHHSAAVDTGSFLSMTRVLVLILQRKEICCCRTRTRSTLSTVSQIQDSRFNSHDFLKITKLERPRTQMCTICTRITLCLKIKINTRLSSN